MCCRVCRTRGGVLRPRAEPRQPRESPDPDARPGILGNRPTPPARVRTARGVGAAQRTPPSAPAATIMRRLLKVNGRPARPGDEPGCMDPKSVATEPLAVFLRERQHEQIFTLDRRCTHRRARERDARLRPPQWASAAQRSWLKKGECVTVDVGARSRGRVWADAETGDVLRLDEWVAGMHEFSVPFEHQRAWNTSSLALERSDSSIRYRPVTLLRPGRNTPAAGLRGNAHALAPRRHLHPHDADLLELPALHHRRAHRRR